MKKNVGGADRIIRLVLGIIIAVVGWMNHSWWGLIAIVPIATALMNFCPLYLPIKLSTAKKDGDA